MAKPGIIQVDVNADTFQSWLDITNDLVEIATTDAMTASALGDTTTGNSTLVGSFTANTIVAFNTLRANTLSPKVGSSAIEVTSPITIETATQTVQTFISTNAPRVSYSNASVIWRVGFESNADTSFIIDTGSGTRKLSLSPSGDLSIAGNMNVGNNLIVENDLTVNGTITGNISGSSGSAGNASTVTNGVYTVGNQTIGGIKTFTSTIVGSISGNAETASQVTNGVYTVGNQTIGGIKTFTSTIVGSISGNAATASNASQVTNGVYTVGNQTIGGIKTFNGGTASTSRTTGTVIITGGLGVSGAINAGGEITAFATSDSRLKSNVENIAGALSKIERLNGVTFNWNDLAKEVESKDTSVKEVGVIAQEVNQVLPEVVTTRENGYMAVRYEKLVPLLIEAIKELNEEIKMLKNGS
jgi:Chaperone of endosialidase